MKSISLFTICTLLMLLAGCAARHPAPVTEAAALMPEGANPNAAELRAFAGAYPQGTPEARAAAFLLENLPAADSLSITEADLRENLEYAFLARRTMPWGQTVPWDVFLSYVLPHRASQEPFQPHRAMLFTELAPICATAASMEEALARVGAWCARKARYQPTSREDMGVRSILDAGYGRCEETNILFMAAARSVGLPVRQAMVPWWQHDDGNHAWVEAWTKDGWKFLESGTVFNTLGQTWFAPQAARMPKVAAHAFGHPHDPAVYRTGPGYAIVDNTAAYTRATAVQVGVTTAGEPVPGWDVYFSVPSMSGLRPVTKAVTDERGVARTTLGPGTFLVTCAAADGLAWSLLDTRDMESAETFLRAESPRDLPDTLEFSHPPAASGLPEITPDQALEAYRQEQAGHWKPLLGSYAADLRQRLALAGARAPEWMRLLDNAREPAARWLPLVAGSLDDKDLIQVDPAALPRDVEAALKARSASEKSGLAYADDVFLRFVLAPRLYLEPWSPWRENLTPWLAGSLGLKLADKIELVGRELESLQNLPKALFGPPLTPAQTHASRFCATAMDKAVLATAALRTMGVPARCAPDFEGLEYFDGKDWQLWKMNRDRSEEGKLLVRGGDLRPIRDFGVAKVREGHVEALDDLPWEESPLGPTCTMEAGTYYLLRVERSGTTARVKLRRVLVAPGERAETTPADGQ